MHFAWPNLISFNIIYIFPSSNLSLSFTPFGSNSLDLHVN